MKRLKNKESKAYIKYKATNIKEDSGIYKFPGEFLVLGIIAILIDLLIEHPIVTPEMTILGIILFVVEAYFLSKRYIFNKKKE
jgi:hypothetical protein